MMLVKLHFLCVLELMIFDEKISGFSFHIIF